MVTNASMNLLPSGLAPQTNHLGRSKFSADPCFNGEYACFRVYGRALSAAEIAAPIPTIALPASGSYYWPGSTIDFSGSATDFADRPLKATNLTWVVNFINAGITNNVRTHQRHDQRLVHDSRKRPLSHQRLLFRCCLRPWTLGGARRQTRSPSIPPPPRRQPTGLPTIRLPVARRMSATFFNGTLKNGASIVNDAVRGNVLNLLPASSQVTSICDCTERASLIAADNKKTAARWRAAVPN